MKKRQNLILYILTIALVITAIVVSIVVARAQEKTTPLEPEPKPQQACPNKTKVFNLEPEAVEAKVKELEAEGYCINKSNLLVVGKQVLLIVDVDNFYTETDECDSGEECE